MPRPRRCASADGGRLRETVLEATVLENVPKTCEVYADEAFGPVAVLDPSGTSRRRSTSSTPAGSASRPASSARDLYKAHRAWDCLEVGGVIIGDAPSWRVDHMPYGGVKDSGIGREGLRFAIEDMTEIRLLAVRTPPSP